MTRKARGRRGLISFLLCALALLAAGCGRKTAALRAAGTASGEGLADCAPGWQLLAEEGADGWVTTVCGAGGAPFAGVLWPAEAGETLLDVVYSQGVFYASFSTPPDGAGLWGYRVAASAQGGPVTLAEGRAGPYESQLPRFARLDGGVVLAVQDDADGAGLFALSPNAEPGLTPLAGGAGGAFASVTPRWYGDRLCLLTEDAGEAALTVYTVGGGEAGVSARYPLEAGAGLIGYALLEDHLLVCCQTAASRDGTPAYEMLSYDLADPDAAPLRRDLGATARTPLAALDGETALCRDDAGALGGVSAARPGGWQPLEGTDASTAVFPQGDAVYLCTGGALSASGNAAPAPTAPPPGNTAYLDAGGAPRFTRDGPLQVLECSGSALLPGWQANQTSVFYEEDAGLFTVRLEFVFDGTPCALTQVEDGAGRVTYYEITMDGEPAVFLPDELAARLDEPGRAGITGTLRRALADAAAGAGEAGEAG